MAPYVLQAEFWQHLDYHTNSSRPQVGLLFAHEYGFWITPICIIWQHFRSVFTCWIYVGTFACGSTHSTSHFFFSWCLIVPASWTCYWRLQGRKEGWPWQGLSPILSGMVIENLVKCEKCIRKGWNESQKPDTVLQFSISGTFSNSVEKRML